MTQYTIIGRTDPKCQYCEKAKALLESNGISYNFIDLAGRQTAIDVFNALGYSTVPLIVTDKTIIGGFEELEIYLNLF